MNTKHWVRPNKLRPAVCRLLTFQSRYSLCAGEKTRPPAANNSALARANSAVQTRGVLHQVQEGREASVWPPERRVRPAQRRVWCTPDVLNCHRLGADYEKVQRIC